jgi:hypothetical protein
MAVLDYLIANEDRNIGNYLTVGRFIRGDLRVVAIDNGFSFTEPRLVANRIVHGRGFLASDFFVINLNVPLSSVMASVAALDPRQVASMLEATGLSQPAIDGVLARLSEIQVRGMITGEAWPHGIQRMELNW